MKNAILLSAALILSASIWAQAPQGISHQAVIRNAQGELVTAQTIGIRVSILQGSAEGTAVFVETHEPVSNENGLITYVIGSGTNVSGTFAEIDWANGSYFLKTEADPGGGNNYSIMGVSQFFYVPYTFLSEKAGTLENGKVAGEMFYWNGEEWVVVTPGQHDLVLHFCNGVPTWGPCPDIYEVNFNVDMSPNLEFNPEIDVVYITGSMFNWAIPGTQPNRQTMHQVNGSMIWSSTLNLEQGEYEYKYFINEGLDGGEWLGEPFRLVSVSENTEIYNTWGSIEPIGLPTVYTLQAANITDQSALISGNLVDQGSTEILETGFYFSSETNAKATGVQIQLDEYIEDFMFSITELSALTNYYYVAYAKNNMGTSYGDEVSFTTESAPPEIVTLHASAITPSSAIIGGEIINEGSTQVTETGVFWGMDFDVLGTGSQVIIEGGMDEFSYEITSLAENSTYYYVPYATNSAGTSFGAIWFFETPAAMPLVNTATPNNITSYSAVLGGNVISDGGFDIIEMGIYFGIEPEPNLSGNKVPLQSDNDEFYIEITSFSPNVLYYFTAYSVNQLGVGFGEEFSFTTEITQPSVLTSNALEIGSNSAILAGKLNHDGGGELTNKGFYWGLEPDPETSGTQIILESDVGSFEAELTGLLPGAIYYYLAFATNSHGTALGEVLDFGTLSIPPTVTTTSATGILHNSAIIGGNITCDGGTETMERGVYWSTELSPQTNGIQVIAGSGSGKFTVPLTGLTQNSTYYFVAYAINSEGTTFGDELMFETPAFDGRPCPGLPNYISDIENNIYYTVQIGGRCWLKENLKTSSYSNSMPIGDSRVWYNNNSAWKPSYGALYSWGAVNSTNGLCPAGWHVPTDTEWTELRNYLTVEYGWSNFQNDPNGVGNKLKSCRQQGSPLGGDCNTTEHPYWFWTETHHFGTDHHGFSALPGGIQEANGVFQNMGTTGIFWSSTENDYTSAWYYGLGNNSGSMSRQNTNKQTKLSVRCIKTASLPQINTTSATNVTNDQATIGGVVIDENGSEVTEAGVYYGSQSNPRVTGTKAAIGSGAGAFSITLTGLSDNGIYHFVAYATSEEGTAFSEDDWFVTQSFLPGISTRVVSNVSSNSALGSGYLSHEGTELVTEMGLCWSTSLSPTLSDNCLSVSPGLGSFNGLITGLTSNTKYYVRAYATNSNGTKYGNNRAFVTLPVITTTSVSQITQNNAISGGEIETGGNETILARGVCWSTLPNPTLSDQHTSDGDGLGSFISSISGVSHGTNYYLRAYAANQTATVYGNQLSFSTLPLKPQVVISQVNSITSTSAIVAGDVTDDGGALIEDRGFLYSTHPYPTLSDNIVWGGSGSGNYTIEITGLSINTTYYVRAYAYNSAGITLSNPVSFKTAKYCPGLPEFIDPRDNTIYGTIQIGNQCWLGENLKFLPEVHEGGNRSNSDPRFYVYRFSGTSVTAAKATSNYDTYGVLYNWPASMDGASSSNANPSGVQGICPPGWHLPSDDEWVELEMYLGMSPYEAADAGFRGTNQGGKLKATILWSSPNLGATNKVDFSALPAGRLVTVWGRNFNRLGERAYWWSSTAKESSGWSRPASWYRRIDYDKSQVGRDYSGKSTAYSIRCIRD